MKYSIVNLVTIFFLAGMTVLQIIVTIRRLIENHWKFELVSERIQLSLVLIVLTLCLFFKRATVMLGGALFLIVAFTISLYCGLKARDKKQPFHIRLLSLLECLAGNLFGFAYLIIPQDTVFAFSVSVGSCLIIDGAVRILFVWLGKKHILKTG